MHGGATKDEVLRKRDHGYFAKRATMNSLFALGRRYRWRIATAIVMSLAAGLGTTCLVALINEALNHDGDRLSTASTFALVAVVVLLTRGAAMASFMIIGQAILADLRKHVAGRFASASLARIERQGTAKGFAVLAEDIDAVAAFFVTAPSLVLQGAVVLACLVYLFYLSGSIFLAALGLIALGSFGYSRASKFAYKHLWAARRQEDTLFQHFRAIFEGAKELKSSASRRASFVGQDLNPAIEAVRAHRTKGMAAYVAAGSLANFLFFAFVGLVIYVLSGLVHVEPRVLSGYALVFLYMITPLEAVINALPALSRARIAYRRICEAIDMPNVDHSIDPATAHQTFENLKLSEVRHAYFREQHNDIFELGPISLEFSPGEIIFLVGGNGSGKTTLAKLIVGLYEPISGEIYVDNVQISDLNRERYRQLFSHVFSDFFLFSRLLDSARPEIKEKADQLLRKLHLDHKLTITDHSFSTVDLSQGQRKRLALLCAFLEDRPFYLFDEWAADQDPEFRRIFYTEILQDLRGRRKCVLVITHDEQYFHVADRILKLDFGKLSSSP